MERTITVKGIGTVSTAPDYIEIPITIETQHMDYEKTVDHSGEKLDELRNSLWPLGFVKEDLKTVSFDVSPRYESEKDTKGNYQRVFRGYCCRHCMKLGFNKDMRRISQVFSALAKCPAKPEFDVRFTVREKAAVSEALLKSAAENALSKAKILCTASGVNLGALLRIDYNWGELNIYSDADFRVGACPSMAEDKCIDIEPENIENTDTVTFVWEIT